MEPRPYWTNPNIKPQSCSLDFASPSDQVIISTMVTSCIFLDIFHGSIVHLRREADFDIFHNNKFYKFCLF